MKIGPPDDTDATRQPGKVGSDVPPSLGGLVGPAILDGDSVRALHEQLSDRLRKDIIAREFSSGRLPPEPELAAKFGVSRSTVRKAVEALVREGLLVRRQGRGTYLAGRPPTIVHSLDHLAPFVDTLERAGQSPDTQLLQWGWIQGDEVPSILGGPEPALQIRRLHIAGGMPHAVANVIVQGEVARRLSRNDTEQPPLFAALRKAQVALGRAEITISCQVPDEKLSEELRISRATPVLLMRGITFNTDGQAVEVTDHFLRSDVYQLTVTVYPEDKK